MSSWGIASSDLNPLIDFKNSMLSLLLFLLINLYLINTDPVLLFASISIISHLYFLNSNPSALKSISLSAAGYTSFFGFDPLYLNFTSCAILFILSSSIFSSESNLNPVIILDTIFENTFFLVLCFSLYLIKIDVLPFLITLKFSLSISQSFLLKPLNLRSYFVTSFAYLYKGASISRSSIILFIYLSISCSMLLHESEGNVNGEIIPPAITRDIK